MQRRILLEFNAKSQNIDYKQDYLTFRNYEIEYAFGRILEF